MAGHRPSPDTAVCLTLREAKAFDGVLGFSRSRRMAHSGSPTAPILILAWGVKKTCRDQAGLACTVVRDAESSRILSVDVLRRAQSPGSFVSN